MPRAYPSEFRQRALALIKAGRSVAQTAIDLEITQATIYARIKQDRIDRGDRPGVTTKESRELRVVRRRIRELEAENEILGRANELLGPGAHRPLAPTKMRREWLTTLIREVHAQSRGIYGSRRVHAELTRGHGVFVSERLVAVLMHNAEISGLPNVSRAKARKLKVLAPSDDLVNRRFARSGLTELWVTDITEHRTKEGKICCCCVLDTCRGLSDGQLTQCRTPISW